MSWSEKDIDYMNRRQALRDRKEFIEDIIVQCLKNKKFRQGRDIVDVVMEFFPDEIPRNILRMIYKIMHVDLKFLPKNYEEDMILL
jgi:hypothetical protein